MNGFALFGLGVRAGELVAAERELAAEVRAAREQGIEWSVIADQTGLCFDRLARLVNRHEVAA